MCFVVFVYLLCALSANFVVRQESKWILCYFAAHLQCSWYFCFVFVHAAQRPANERKPWKVKRRPVSSTQSCYGRITQCLCCVHTFEMHWAWAFDSIRVYYMRRVKNAFRIRTASALTITHRHTCTLFTGKLQPGAQAISGWCRWCTTHSTPYSYIYISWTTHWCLCAKLELHLFAFCVFCLFLVLCLCKMNKHESALTRRRRRQYTHQQTGTVTAKSSGPKRAYFSFYEHHRRHVCELQLTCTDYFVWVERKIRSLIYYSNNYAMAFRTSPCVLCLWDGDPILCGNTHTTHAFAFTRVTNSLWSYANSFISSPILHSPCIYTLLDIYISLHACWLA